MLIRDPVHGDIELGDLERRLLDCAAVQRLRGIRQLGAAHLVYPGCNHTRFEHALGTLHTAKRILGQLEQQGHRVGEWGQAVTAAALLHDTGFVPFGHFFEDVLGLLPRHDTPGRLAAVWEEEVAGVLGPELQPRVTAIFTGEAPGWARAIIAGVIDADLLDYLRRDAYYAGLRQGYDDRIFRYLTLAGDVLAVATERDGMYRPDAVSELINLLRLRYYLMERVYHHHAKLAAESMVGLGLQVALARGYPPERLYRLGDAELPAELAAAGAAGLMEAFARRRLFKRAYVLSPRTVPPAERARLTAGLRQPGKRQEFEQLLAGPGRMAAVCCLPISLMKEAAVPLAGGSGLAQEVPLDVQALEAGYRNLWRLYVFAPAEDVSAVEQAAVRHFGSPSEHRRSGG